jgi:hypothetical protein
MSMRKFSVIMALIACFPGSHLPVTAAITVSTADPAKTIPAIQIIQPNPNDSALRLEVRQDMGGQTALPFARHLPDIGGGQKSIAHPACLHCETPVAGSATLPETPGIEAGTTISGGTSSGGGAPIVNQ